MPKRTYPDQEVCQRGEGDGVRFMRAIIREKPIKGYNRTMLYKLPAQELAIIQQINEHAASLGMPAYLVGGVVRDLILDNLALDIDIVLEGDAVQLAHSLVAKHGGSLTTHAKFRTATWQPLEGQSIDLITARREAYLSPAALPRVTPSTLEDDLARRDFSINTLAIRLSDGALIDIHKGQADLRNGLVRVLHPHSFQDDPTRLYRAVRYEVRYTFQIAPETLSLIPAALPFVERLTPERIRHELDLSIAEPRPALLLARLEELGLLKAVVDTLPWDSDLLSQLDSALSTHPDPEWGLGQPVSGIPFRQILSYALWLGHLPLSQISILQERLTFPLAVLKNIQAVSTLMAQLPADKMTKPSGWVQKLTGLPLPALYAAYLISGEEAIKRYVTHWQHIHPKTDGEALKALGLPPGPRYQEILWRLRAAWLDGEITSFHQEEKLFREIVHS